MPACVLPTCACKGHARLRASHVCLQGPCTLACAVRAAMQRRVSPGLLGRPPHFVDVANGSLRHISAKQISASAASAPGRRSSSTALPTRNRSARDVNLLVDVGRMKLPRWNRNSLTGRGPRQSTCGDGPSMG
eukprot:365355-Chlamydomonas_euryale.AAC.9